MKAKTFVDTNILVYTGDQGQPEKRAKSIQVLQGLLTRGGFVVSTQVLLEYFSASTKKLGMEPKGVRQLVRDLCLQEVVPVRPRLVEEAIDLTLSYSLSLWDALIVAAAKEASCTVLLSEDMQNGATISGVRVENPLQ